FLILEPTRGSKTPRSPPTLGPTRRASPAPFAAPAARRPSDAAFPKPVVRAASRTRRPRPSLDDKRAKIKPTFGGV
ncbi:MAG: hypothetical protein IIW01_09605, partial [Thermoguttaceae bacterium]|nr:hypothetical protein [Thermoguttaceae bacterium]